MRKCIFIVALLACLLTIVGRADAQRALKVGDVAPALSASVDGKPVPAFAPGQVYVLEFWASWCGPCLAAFPHLNELTESLKGQPVTFLSVTGDPRAKVERLLKSRPLRTQIAYDRDGKTFAAYGVRVIPYTVIIGRDGKIAAVTNPRAVTVKALQDALVGLPLDLPVETNVAADLEWNKQISADAPESLAQVIVQRSRADSGASRFRPNSGQIVGDGITLGNLIQLAYSAEFFEMKNSLADSPIRYRVSVRAPDSQDGTARTLLKSILPTLTPFSARWIEEEATVPILRRIPGTPAIKTSTAAVDGLARSGELAYTGVSFKMVASALGSMVFHTNVIDETGYTGAYDVTLAWTPGDAASLEAALKPLGLQILQEKRMVRRLIVEPMPSK